MQATDQKHRGAFLRAFLLVLFWSLRLCAQTTAVPGHVLDLDGKDSCVELPAKLFTNEVVTIEGWVKWRSFGSYSRFFEFADAALMIGVANRAESGDLRVVRPRTREYEGLVVSDAPDHLVAGQWQHLAVVAGTNFVKLYSNGQRVALSDVTVLWRPTRPPVLKNFLGRSVVKEVLAAGEGERDLNGQMAEVRLWAGERSAEEIIDNMFNPQTGNEPGLIGLWNFENVTDGVVKDHSPGHHDGKLMGHAKTVAGGMPAPLAAARDARVLDLDGTNAFVVLPSGLVSNEVVTVEGWFKWRKFGNYSRLFDFYGEPRQFGIHNLDTQATLVFERPERLATGQIRRFLDVDAPSFIATNEWCHVAAVMRANSTKLFFNGVLVATEATYINWAPPTEPDRTNYLGRSSLSSHRRTGENPDFDGQMTEIRLWAGERTEAQIRETMFQKLTGREPGLAGLWNFADLAHPGNDATPNGHHGTLMGQAKVVEAMLPSAATFAPWSRLRVQVTDAAGAPLQNVSIRAEVEGVRVGGATTDWQGNTTLTVWTRAPAVDLLASGLNDLGGWQVGVPITPYSDRTNTWKLGRPINIAGRATTLDGKTPQASLVVELVQPTEDGRQEALTKKAANGEQHVLRRSSGAEAGKTESDQRLVTSVAVNRALRLDGSTNSFVELPLNLLPGARELTFEAWLKWDEFAFHPTAFCLGARSRNLLLTLGDNNSEAFGIVSDGVTVYPSVVGRGRTLELHQWEHVAGGGKHQRPSALSPWHAGDHQ